METERNAVEDVAAYITAALTKSTASPTQDDAVTFLMLGADIRTLPQIAGLTYVEDAAHPFDCVAIADARSVGEMQPLLERDPLVPVVVFGVADGVRADFAAPDVTLATLRHALDEIHPIRARVDELPALDDNPDRDGLLPLALAYTRQKAIDAAWAPLQREAVWYPLLGPIASPRLRLEPLASANLLQRRFFRRVTVCGGCGSARLAAFEACVECGGGQLGEEQLVHHYACGQKSTEKSFRQGRDLICPKCEKDLRHLGVDYDKPGAVITCQTCTKVMAEPGVAFDCLDCGHATPGDAAETVDWYHYDLTPEGIASLQTGRLPQLDLGDLLTPFARAYPVRDFVMLSREALNVAERYERPFTLLATSVLNRDELKQEFGSNRLADAFRLMVDIFAETIREVDLITATSNQRIVMALPETPVENASVLIDRLEKKVKSNVELPIRLDSTVGGGQDALKILETCE